MANVRKHPLHTKRVLFQNFGHFLEALRKPWEMLKMSLLKNFEQLEKFGSNFNMWIIFKTSSQQWEGLSKILSFFLMNSQETIAKGWKYDFYIILQKIVKFTPNCNVWRILESIHKALRRPSLKFWAFLGCSKKTLQSVGNAKLKEFWKISEIWRHLHCVGNNG